MTYSIKEKRMSHLADLSRASMEEFLYMACGEKLGGGMSRQVYLCAFDASKVIKVENSITHFQNVMEWETWSRNQYHDKTAKWLAPCRMISHSGTFLVMDYARDLLESELPRQMPAFATDLKAQNMGMLHGRVVLRDYGTPLLKLDLRLRNR